MDLIKQLLDNSIELTQFLQRLTDEQVNNKQSSDKWSIMDCMEHVFITEKGIYKLLTQPLLFNDTPSVGLGRIDEFRKGKFMAPEFTVPKGRYKSLDALLVDFLQQRMRITHFCISEDAFAEIVTYPHPIIGPLSKKEWVIFMREHAYKHLLQMKNLV